jgi:hypothetical protein
MVRGTTLYPPPEGEATTSHVARAFWLTTKVETGAKFGSIVMYDGTAVTAGLDQHIAVYPRELANEDHNAKDDQGTFWKLPHYNVILGRVFDLLKKHGWYLAQDGVLRYLDSDLVANQPVHAGDAVFGFHIRAELTPPGGAVPRMAGEWRSQSFEWAQAFHHLFSHEAGWKAQVEYGKEHLVKRTKRRRINVGTKKNPEWWKVLQAAYGGRELTALRAGVELSMEEDLALCVYQSNSVNAPAIANKALARSLKGPLGHWPERLIEYLGNSDYGRWDDDLPTGRYQRTRSAARASGLWPRAFFDGKNAIMPKDLPG